MSIVIRQIHPVFVGEVSGIDIARPLTPAEVAALEAGMDRYAVLVFHDQKVMWDNRQMMHRVRRYDERQPRDMHRTTVAGDVGTTAQVE
jgi:alpha-ketoglutarate-dependent taurine dioxygenase